MKKHAEDAALLARITRELPDVVCVHRGPPMTKKELIAISEMRLDVYLSGELAFSLSCIDDSLEALILGHLLTQGYIETVLEVETIRRQPEREESANMRVFDVLLCETQEQEGKSHLYAWQPAWIFSLADRFAASTQLYITTHCAHSCLLAREDRILYQCEDVGRHNALDKVIGCAMRDHVDLSSCILYLSGRVPLDMMEKVHRSGVRIVASNSTTTLQAAEFATQNQITLICSVRPEGFDLIYNAAKTT